MPWLKPWRGPEKKQAMEELTPYRNEAGLTNLTAENIVALRLNGDVPKYGALPKRDRILWTIDEITKLNILTHQELKREYVKPDSVQLDAYIAEDPIAADLTLQEIDYALREGLKTEYFGLTSPNMYRFVRDYYTSNPAKLEATRRIREIRSGKATETEEQRKQRLNEIRQAYVRIARKTAQEAAQKAAAEKKRRERIYAGTVAELEAVLGKERLAKLLAKTCAAPAGKTPACAAAPNNAEDGQG